MANNVQITPGTGDVVGAEDIGSVKFQKVKLVDATAGSTAGTGILGNPLVVSGSTTIIGSVTVTGSTAIVGSVTVTGSTAIVGSVTITGSTAIVGTPTVIVSTGSLPLTVTGSTAVVNSVTVTGTSLVIQPTAANLNAVVSNGTISVYQAAAAQLNATITGSVVVINTHPVTIPTASTALIGTVIVSNGTNVAVTGSVVVVSHPAITGSVSVVNSTLTVTGSTAIVGTVSVSQVKRSTAVSGKLDSGSVVTASTVVASVSGQYINITSYLISSSVAGAFWLEDTAGTAITCKHYFAPSGGVAAIHCESAPLSTAITNTTINIKGSASGSVGCLVLGYSS